MFSDQMKLLDFSKPIQVFNGSNSEPMDTLDITHKMALMKGAQGDVFLSTIKGLKGYFVDKTK